jgi:broad specificity phosphatase PhoE
MDDTLSTMSSETIAILVRHGRVRNPNHVVYGHLPGFDLDAVGVLEAHRTSRQLATTSIDAVISSPLIRARHTAEAIAMRHGIDVVTDDRLSEWDVSPVWLGQRWEDIPSVAPGELESYLADPSDLAWAHESLADVVDRMTSAVEEHVSQGRTTVFVSHQDPVNATILALTHKRLDTLLDDPPPHASATTLVRAKDATWTNIGRTVPHPSS